MGRWLDRLASGARSVWLSDTAYTARVLMNGAVTWMDPGALVQWRRKTLQLLNPDVAVLDLLALAKGWSPAPGAPPNDSGLRTVLGNEQFAAYARDLLRALRVSTDKPLALDMPSPRKWLTICPGLGAGEGVAEDDMIEDLAGETARFLRLQGDAGLDVILLHEDDVPAAQIGPLLACYKSLVNTARHFRWDLGVHLPHAHPAPVKHFDFVIAPRDAAGIELLEAFWQGEDAPPATPGSFYYAEIPESAQPSEVLERLRSLR
ncbi:MAG: hypothetical protein JWN85_680 [Gammaproteobacteria bacterium]|nr:hypothetical protein [Gammaproteobacteria bacterium]